MPVERPPKSIIWKGNPKARKVSKIRTVSTIHRTTKAQPPAADGTGTDTGTAAASSTEANGDSDGEPPGLCDDSSDDEAPAEDEEAKEEQLRDSTLHDGESDDEPPALCENDSSSDDGSEAEHVVEAKPQHAAEAQPKPTAKRVRPPMAKHTPVFTRGHTQAMLKFFGREPGHDDESAQSTKKQLNKTRETRTVYQCNSEEPPVKVLLSIKRLRHA